MKKLLLTGADGFTGLHFTAQAQAQGYAVTPLKANLLDYAALAAEVLQIKPDCVVHLAAISFVGHGNTADFYKVNVEGAENLLKACLALPSAPEKILMVSSANVYGNCASDKISETQTLAPANHYALSKVAMEQMCAWYAARLNIVITRPFNYTGLGQAPQFVIPKIVQHFTQKAAAIELGNIEVYREYNDVRWLCAAYLGLLSAPCASGEVFNIASGKSYSLNEVMTLLQSLTQHQLDIKVNPAFVRSNEVKKLAGNGDKLSALLGAGALPNIDLQATLKWMLQSQA